MIYSLVKSWD